MALSEDEARFLKRRRWFVKSWKVVAVLVVVGLGAVLVYLSISAPQLVNPMHVARQLEAKAVERLDLEVQAVLLPVAILGWFAIVAAVIVLGFGVIANERKHLAIIDRLTGGDGPPADDEDEDKDEEEDDNEDDPRDDEA